MAPPSLYAESSKARKPCHVLRSATLNSSYKKKCERCQKIEQMTYGYDKVSRSRTMTKLKMYMQMQHNWLHCVIYIQYIIHTYMSIDYKSHNIYTFMTSARYHHYYHHVLPTMYGITASLSWPARRLPVVLPLPPSRPSILYEIHVAFRLPASADRGISVQNYTTCYMTQAQELYNDYNYIINYIINYHYQNRGESIGSFPVHPSTNQGSNLKNARSNGRPKSLSSSAMRQLASPAIWNPKWKAIWPGNSQMFALLHVWLYPRFPFSYKSRMFSGPAVAAVALIDVVLDCGLSSSSNSMSSSEPFVGRTGGEKKDGSSCHSFSTGSESTDNE